MLLLGIHALIELPLHLPVLLAALLQTLGGRLDSVFKNFLNILNVVQQHFFRLLVCAARTVHVVDFLQVSSLVCEKLLGGLVRVRKVAVLPVVVRLGVQIVKQLNEALVELGKLDIRWTRLNLSLKDGNLTILLGKIFLLRQHLVVFFVVFCLNLL